MSKATAKRIAILGFGREGQSLLRFLKKNPEYRGSEIWILDRDASVETKISEAKAKNIHFQTGHDYLKNLERFSVIFRSPGIPYLLPEIVRAKRHGVKIESATRIFFEIFSRKTTPRIIGVTGTKGKGTTSTLIAHILKKNGYRVVTAGNIGEPMLDSIPSALRADFVVLELSSFQLQDLLSSPPIAVVLDVFPDHLDAHRSLAEYFKSKSNIASHQHPSDTVFFFKTNARSRKIGMMGQGKKIAITPKKPGLEKNYEMAAAVARFLKIPEEAIEKSIRSFKGLEHRLEFVKKIALGKPSMKTTFHFYNDSAATNPQAAAAAIQTIRFPLILIAGGKDKNLDYSPLRDALRKSPHVQGLVLIGENREKIRDTISSVPKLVIEEATTLRGAVKAAMEIVKERGLREAAILFSPAAASFDMFKSYTDRGEQFKKIVRRLAT